MQRSHTAVSVAAVAAVAKRPQPPLIMTVQKHQMAQCIQMQLYTTQHLWPLFQRSLCTLRAIAASLAMMQSQTVLSKTAAQQVV